MKLDRDWPENQLDGIKYNIKNIQKTKQKEKYYYIFIVFIMTQTYICTIILHSNHKKMGPEPEQNILEKLK